MYPDLQPTTLHWYTAQDLLGKPLALNRPDIINRLTMWSMERASDRLFEYVNPVDILLDSCRNPEYQKVDERSTSNADISPAAIEQLLATIFPNRRLSVSFDRLGSSLFSSCEVRYKISVPYGDYVILRIQRHENEKSAEEALRRRLNTYVTLHMFEEQKLETPKLGYLTLAAPYAVHWIRGGIYVFMRAGGAGKFTHTHKDTYTKLPDS